MATISDYFEQAQLSQAAYASGLTPRITGIAYTDALQGGGMSAEQAKAFANQYNTVIDQYTEPVSGFSGTVFQDVSGSQYLAIRGTQTNLGIIADGITDIGVYLNLNGVDQYQQLQTFYQSLVASGKVQPGNLNVTGHSLGGLLAQMFAVDHTGAVAQTVTFNAPGVGGVGTQIRKLLGIVESSVPAGNVTNIIAQPGWSATAGLGLMLGNVSNVFIETSLNPLLNHKIAKLSDSLAVYDLFAKVDPTLDNANGIKTITGLLKASDNTASESLEHRNKGTYMDYPALQGESLKGNKGKVAHIYPAFE